MLIKNNHGAKKELPSDQNTAAHIGRKDPLSWLPSQKAGFRAVEPEIAWRKWTAWLLSHP